jgi:hypothetical protein
MLFPEAWHERFLDFAGTLPEITSFRTIVLRARFLISATGPFGERYRCLYTVDQRARIPVSRRSAERIEIITQSDPGIRLAEGNTVCPNGGLAGTFTLERAREIRLI